MTLDILPEALTAISLLEQKGYESFIVGGAVRNLIMGIKPDDWDIATNALPWQTAEVFSDYHMLNIGIKHGTVTVIINNIPLQITTFRTEGSYSDIRHPDSVEFVSSLKEDLVRRDFTINSLAYNPKTGIVDHFGGQTDIRQRIIRCVGNPEHRFSEDALRILRAIRFSSVLSFSLDKDTSKAVHSCSYLLKNISSERIREEMTKLLCGPNIFINLQNYRDVISVIIPELSLSFDFDQKSIFHRYDVWTHTCYSVQNSKNDPCLRWASLLHDIGKPACFSLDKLGEGHFYNHAEKSAEIASKIVSRLCFDKKTGELIVFLVRYHSMTLPENEKAVRKALLKHSLERMLLILEMKTADAMSLGTSFAGNRDAFTDYAKLLKECYKNMCAEKEKPILAVNGNDLIAYGLKGPKIGNALSLLKEAVFVDGLSNEKNALISFLKQNHIVE